MRRQTFRRGGTAVEQALVLPVLIVMLMAGFEYGWTFFRLHQVESFARQAGRIAAATPVDDDPASVFADEFEALMTGGGLGTQGLDVDATVDGDSPERTLEVTVTLEWGGLTGLIPVPANLNVDYSTWREDQSRTI